MKKIVYLLAAVMMMAGCASSGTQVTSEQLSQFIVGVTTPSDVIAKLGPPNHQANTSSGMTILSYGYSNVSTRPETFIPFVGAFVGGADVKTNSASFVFDKNGKLQSTSSSSGNMWTGMGAAVR
jgi:hypothetical protein